MKLTKPFTAAFTGIALLTSTAACAQTQTLPKPVETTQAPAETVEMAAEQAAGAPALWKVADEDTTIYMFGTVHALPDNVDWYKGEIKTALDESSVLVTEIDMTDETTAKMQQLVGQMAILPPGTTLRSLFNEEQTATYEAAMASLGAPAAALDPLEPWFAAIAMSQIAFQKAGITGENGTETVLEAIVGDSKEREALETVEFQLGIFDNLPQDAQIKYLIDAAEEIDNLAPELQKIIDGWAVGDVETVANLLNEAFQEDPALVEALLYERNSNWAEWIETRMAEPGTVFMAVGAGHLVGENSVQDYLVERGIQSARVQ